ncbi:MAG: DUF2849 domain-containing protein [Pseudomonadota bacterium]
MARAFKPKIATANDLLEGDVVYFTQEGTWSRRHSDAEVAQTESAAALLLARAQGHPLKVVGPYLADVTLAGDGTPEPAHFREAFRTRGPSNYFHGKQAEPSDV